MNCRGRTHEFYPVGKSCLMTAEIRPVACIIDSVTGPVKTTKWMNLEHWKDLDFLVKNVLRDYDPQKHLSINANVVDSADPGALQGSLLKIGYFYKKTSRTSGHFMMPRSDIECIDFETDDLQDKGRRYSTLKSCAESLVIAVSPLDQIDENENSASTDTRLVQALDPRSKNPSSISEYFQPKDKPFKCSPKKHDKESSPKNSNPTHRSPKKESPSKYENSWREKDTKSSGGSGSSGSSTRSVGTNLTKLSACTVVLNDLFDDLKLIKGKDYSNQTEISKETLQKLSSKHDEEYVPQCSDSAQTNGYEYIPSVIRPKSPVIQTITKKRRKHKETRSKKSDTSKNYDIRTMFTQMRNTEQPDTCNNDNKPAPKKRKREELINISPKSMESDSQSTTSSPATEKPEEDSKTGVTSSLKRHSSFQTKQKQATLDWLETEIKNSSEMISDYLQACNDSSEMVFNDSVLLGSGRDIDFDLLVEVKNYFLTLTNEIVQQCYDLNQRRFLKLHKRELSNWRTELYFNGRRSEIRPYRYIEFIPKDSVLETQKKWLKNFSRQCTDSVSFFHEILLSELVYSLIHSMPVMENRSPFVSDKFEKLIDSVSSLLSNANNSGNQI